MGCRTLGRELNFEVETLLRHSHNETFEDLETFSTQLFHPLAGRVADVPSIVFRIGFLRGQIPNFEGSERNLIFRCRSDHGRKCPDEVLYTSNIDEPPKASRSVVHKWVPLTNCTGYTRTRRVAAFEKVSAYCPERSHARPPPYVLGARAASFPGRITS